MTLNNLQGVDSFTRNHWHSRPVFRIDVGPPVKQRIEAVCVFPSLQVEHVEQTLGEHSPPLTPICSSPTIPMPMPMHHELFCSHSCISHLLIAHWVAGDATALSVPTRKYLWSSGWTALPTLAGTSTSSSSPISSTNATLSTSRRTRIGSGVKEAESVCTRSGFSRRTRQQS